MWKFIGSTIRVYIMTCKIKIFYIKVEIRKYQKVLGRSENSQKKSKTPGANSQKMKFSVMMKKKRKMWEFLFKLGGRCKLYQVL